MAKALVELAVAGAQPEVTVRITAVEEGGFTAECLEIPGCFSEGETYLEAEQNIRKAIDSCLSVIFEDLLQKIRGSASASFARPAGFPLETLKIRLPGVDRAA